MPSQDFRLTEGQVLVLPLDQLAIQVLVDVIANGEWNSNNWMNLAMQSGAYSARGVRALAEAWQWLSNNGLVAHDYDQGSAGAMFVTRLGHHTARSGLTKLRAEQALAVDRLHPGLETKVRPQFLLGEYETAAFVAMRAVEIRVRELAHAPDSLIGVKLMRQALGTPGPLVDPTLTPGEQVARMELFAGAIGTIKNPTSHRYVHYEDPTEAAEVILFADLLMRILDRLSLPEVSSEPS